MSPKDGRQRTLIHKTKHLHCVIVNSAMFPQISKIYQKKTLKIH